MKETPYLLLGKYQNAEVKRIHEEFADGEGLPETARIKNFDFHICLNMFGMKGTLERVGHLLPEKLTLSKSIWSKERLHQESKQRLVERLKIIKAAWLQGGGLPQSWFNENGTKIMKLSRILEGLAQFKSDVVPLPAGLPVAALVKDFNFHRCLDIFGLKSTLEDKNADVKCIHDGFAKFKSDWMPLPEGLPKTAITFMWSKEKFHRESKQRLVERLKVIKTAWIKGGGLPQKWFKYEGLCSGRY